MNERKGCVRYSVRQITLNMSGMATIVPIHIPSIIRRLCSPSCYPIRPSIPRRTESARDLWLNLPRIRVIEMWLIGELAARNIGGMTTAPRGGILLSSLLSLAPLYNSRHHHRDARPPGIPPACVSLHSPAPSPRRARTLIFGSVLTRLPAATTDVSLDTSPPSRGEHFLPGPNWQNTSA